MKYSYLYIFILLPFLACQSNHTSQEKKPTLDITVASDSVSLFGEGIISTALFERDLAINPKGTEIVYTLGDYKQSRRSLVVMRQENGEWTAPEILPFSGSKHHDIEPFYTNEGNRIYFASNRPIFNDSTRNDYNIWYTDKVGGEWAEPIALDSIINTKGDEFFPSLSDKGNLFFTATREDGIGREDIFMSQYKEGHFLAPEVLPVEINTAYYEFNAYISPKEDLLIFSSYGRKDGQGGGDLYISRKDEHGNWGESKNMGTLINSEKLDFCPFIDWENRIFYFSSERTVLNTQALKTVSDIKQLAHNPLNGFSNIYKMSLDVLDNY